MSKGSNSSTTSTAPNPAAMQAYNDLLQRAGQVSQTPYQAFGGEEVAPVNAQQTTGINNVNANAGFANPFVMQGEQNIAAGAAPINASDISHYYDPYNAKVIQATQADFDTQNKRANSITTGNAAAQGALGGNRVGVAQALTQEGQERVQAPVIAGLQSSGFNNAQNAAMADKARGIAGGTAQIQGGVAGQTAGLQGAGAQIGAGTLQQTTQQTQDTQARTDYYQAMGYPFQTAQWLAGIDTGVGSQMGGTSTTQGPQPNQFAQAAGAGLTALAFAKHGGRIPGFAAGGSPSAMPWGEGQGWVPTIGLTGGKGAPEPPKLPGSQNSPFGADAAKGLGALAKKAGGLFSSQGSNGLSTDAPDSGFGIYTGDASQPGFAGSPGFTDGSSGFDTWYASGGRIPRRGFADGGVPVSAGFGGSPMIDLTDLPPLRTYGPDSADDIQSDNAGLRMAGRDGDRVAASNAGVLDREQPSIAEKGEQIFRGIAGRKPDALPAGVAAYADDGGSSDATDFSAVRRAPTAQRGVIPPGVAAAPEAAESHGLLNLSDEARQGLISMGLGMMANTRGGKGSFLTAVGQGGEQGMTTYASAKAATAALAALRQKEAFERRKQDELQAHRTALETHQKAIENQGNYTITAGTGTDPDTGSQVPGTYKLNRKTGETTFEPGKILGKTPITTPHTDPLAPATGAEAPIPPQERNAGLPQGIVQLAAWKPDKGEVLPAANVNPERPLTSDQLSKGQSYYADKIGKVLKAAENSHEPDTHPEILDSIKKNLGSEGIGVAGLVKAVSEGRLKLESLPSRTVEYNGQKYQLRDLVSRGVVMYNPSWEQSRALLRAETMRDLSPKGTTGKLVLGVNQLLPHLKTASDAAEELNNKGFPAANTIANLWITATGDPRVKKFETVRDVAALDAARILRGAGAFTIEEVRKWEDNIKSSGSPAQLQGVLNLLAGDLMGARMNSIQHSYRMFVGKEAPDLLSPEAKDALSVIEERDRRANASKKEGASTHSPASGFTGRVATGPNGTKLRETSDGKWVP